MPSRRVFLKMVGLAAGAVSLIPARLAQAKKVGLKLDKVAELQKVGGWAIVPIKEETVLLIRDGEASIRAMTAICTHKKCKVAYLPDDKRIRCKCHKSFYDLDGKNTDGPAPAPLRQFKAELRGEQIVIDLG
ncbi:MAG: Cytochrome b6-f complex iron-sulfur subunit [Myxococcota bacterium]|nr:Cytochrome b6-f complex iron-sulfur subunit [Myxococcota bacterium]